MEHQHKLTKAKAIQAVIAIEESKGDDAQAHTMEDTLYHEFVDCLADGMYDDTEAIQIANIIRETSKIKFNRWTA